MRRSRLAVCAALLLASVASSAAAAAPPAYVRAGIGWEESGDATLADLDCAAVAPPALFGCGAGIDGRPLAARGDFGSPAAVEVGAGVELGRRTRVELAVGSRPLALDAEASFLGVTGEQPVRAAGRSTTLLAIAALDLGPARWRVRPFLAAGAGVARNRIEAPVFAFPGIAPGAITRVQGGSHSDFAWTTAVGASVRLSARATLELALRHLDLGELETDPGEALIVRPTRTLRLGIAGTRADLETRGATLSIRYRAGRSSPTPPP